MEKLHRSRKNRTSTYVLECVAVVTTLLVLLFASDMIRYASDARKSAEGQTADGNNLSEINEDYYCDLYVPDSDIAFHVVRGNDNLKYLHTSFSGEESELGAVFMDYRCDLDTQPHTIIYGHDAQDFDGNALMFGQLRGYLDEEFIRKHTEITLCRDGETTTYQLFAVKVTDTDDDAYCLDFDDKHRFEEFADRMGAPDGTREILTLSTCLGTENNMRLLIQGAVVR